MKECEITRDGERLVARIKGEIDHHSAKGIREKIDGELSGGRVRILELDFSSVSFMDSSGIGLILGRASKAEGVGACVEVTGLSGALRRIVRMSGVEKIPSIFVK